MDKNDVSASLELACEKGELKKLAEEYIVSCNILDEEKEAEGDKRKSKRKAARFPNVAGFCRFLGIGQTRLERLSKKYPEEFERVAAVLEDEALNAEISPSLLGVYLKRRLGYAETEGSAHSDLDMGQLKLVFEHDIFADGE